MLSCACLQDVPKVLPIGTTLGIYGVWAMMSLGQSVPCKQFSLSQAEGVLEVLQGVHKRGFVHGQFDAANIFAGGQLMALLDFSHGRRKS